jgi:hypothetical protein
MYHCKNSHSRERHRSLYDDASRIMFQHLRFVPDLDNLDIS